MILNWIKNGNNCDKCKWFCENRCETECGTEYDCYCLIKGDRYDNGCWLVNPFRYLIGRVHKKRNDYYMEHEYDGIGEWYEQQQKNEKALADAIKEELKDFECYRVYSNGDKAKKDINEYIDSVTYRVVDKYENVAHPVVYKGLTERWKEVLEYTWKRIVKIWRCHV